MIELIEGKKHLVVKRKGHIEEYNPEKMKKVLRWAIVKAFHDAGMNADEVIVQRITDEILNDVQIRIFDKINISKLFDEVIDTVANKITELAPFMDNIAKNLFIQKLYKEIWGIKRNEYPHYKNVLEKGVRYNVYNKRIIETFTEEEINQLNEAIKPSRDFMFTFGGINLFSQKYLFKYTKTKTLELPQHAMMRVAIQLHYKDKNRIDRIIEKYNDISLHKLVIPSPVYLNALSPLYNPTSCVLIQPEDDSESLMEAARSMAIYSKNASGLGFDVSRVRAVGSSIGVDGVSSGVVPFLKVYEQVVSAWNQRSVRIGACAVYYPWWHYEAPEIVMLKDAGGSDEDRARKLKYAIKWNKRFSRAIRENEEIYLFDPKEVPNLIEATGKEFDEWYQFYKEKADKGVIRKRKIMARELAFMYIKVYTETGNNYWFNLDETNRRRMSAGFINQSNLCLVGDTKIKIRIENNIKTINIADLKFELEKSSDIKILSFDTESKTQEYQKILAFGRTSTKSKIMKITDKNTGKYIKCTPDHKVWTENRGYVKAKNLKESDIVRIS